MATNRVNIKAFLLSLGLVILFPSVKAFSPFSSTSVYLVAHQDDWQYFMGRTAWNDIRNPAKKVIFIYLTAGDACNGTRPCTSGKPYFFSRENGAKNSVVIASHTGTIPQGVPPFSSNSITWVHNHALARWHHRNTVSYFFRLPDGRTNPDKGYDCGFQAQDSSYINLFRKGRLKRLSDITGLTTYPSWSDLATTLCSVIHHESDGNPVHLHSHEFRKDLNKGTHPDHRETGLLADYVRHAIPGVRICHYLDYITGDMDINLSSEEIQAETLLYDAYDAAKTAEGCPSDRKTSDLEWCKREYISRISEVGPSAGDHHNRTIFLEINGKYGGQVSFSIRVNSADEISCILYDLHGRPVLVLEEQILPSPGMYRFSFPSPATGIYLLKARLRSGATASGKIMIN